MSKRYHALQFIFCLMTPSTPLLADFEYQLNPRGEIVQSTQPFVRRLFTKAQGQTRYEDFMARAEGFVEYDFAPSADTRRSQSSSVLQEAFVEYKWNHWILRAGQQPVRWSDTWLLPSLDVWTSRRWNRFFFDPVSEQLIHPTGVLLNFANENMSLDFFQNLIPGQNQWPKPTPESTPQIFNQEWGTRGKLRSFGADFNLVFVEKGSDHTLGGGISYAFDYLVAKFETGHTGSKNHFTTIGTDFFYEQWSLLPQFTHFRTHPSVANENENVFYIPVTFTDEPHQIEFQGLHNFQTKDIFSGVRYSYSWNNGFQLTGYVQEYDGYLSTLIKSYRQMLKGTAVGLKLDYYFSNDD